MHTYAHIFAGNLADARKPPCVVGFPLSPKGTVTEDERPYLEAKARNGDDDAFRRLYHQDPAQANKKVLRDHAITGCVYSAFGELNNYDRWRALTELDQLADDLARRDLDAPRRLAAECASTAYALMQTALIKLNSVNVEASDEHRRAYMCHLRTVASAELMLLRAIKRIDDLDRRTTQMPAKSATSPVASRLPGFPPSHLDEVGEPKRTGWGDAHQLIPSPEEVQGCIVPCSADHPTTPIPAPEEVQGCIVPSNAEGAPSPAAPPLPGSPSPRLPVSDVLQLTKTHETEEKLNLKQALIAYERWKESSAPWPLFAPTDPIRIPYDEYTRDNPSDLGYEERHDEYMRDREARRRAILEDSQKEEVAA
jgi:hypothetical protein